MESISGGNKDLLKKGMAFSLALMPFASSTIQAMQNEAYSNQETVKTMSIKVKEFAEKYKIPLGILKGAGAATGIAGLYLIYMNLSNKDGNSKHSDISNSPNNASRHINNSIKLNTNLKCRSIGPASSHTDLDSNEDEKSLETLVSTVKYSQNDTDSNTDLDEDEENFVDLASAVEYSPNGKKLLAKAIWDIRNDSCILDRVAQKFNIEANADAKIFDPSCGLVVIRDCADSVPYNSLEELERNLLTTKFLYHATSRCTSQFAGTWALLRVSAILPYILAEQYLDEQGVQDFKEWERSLPAWDVMYKSNDRNELSSYIDDLISSNQRDDILQIKALKLLLKTCSNNNKKCISLIIRVGLGQMSANDALISYRDYMRNYRDANDRDLPDVSPERTVSVNSRACELLRRMCTPNYGESVVEDRIQYDSNRNPNTAGAYGSNRGTFFTNVVERFGGFTDNQPLDYFASRINSKDIQVPNSRDVFEDKYKKSSYFVLQGALKTFMESEYLLNCERQHRAPCVQSQIFQEIKNLRNLPALVKYIRNFIAEHNNDYELYMILNSLINNSKRKYLLNPDVVENESDEPMAHIVGCWGLDWQQSLHLLDRVFAPSLEKFWFSDNTNEDIINTLIRELQKFSKYVQDPSTLTVESSNFKRIKRALNAKNLNDSQQESMDELLNILEIDKFNDDNQLLEAIHNVKLIDWEKLMCCTLDILTSEENEDLYKFASEDYFDLTTIAPDNEQYGFGKRNWLRDNGMNFQYGTYNSESPVDVSVELFREPINRELKISDADSNVPSNNFYEIENPNSSIDNLISADEVERVFGLDCKGPDATGRPEEAYAMLDKWFPNEHNAKGTTVADFLITRGFHNRTTSGGDTSDYSNSITFKAIALLEKLMREVGLESYINITELQSLNGLTDKQKIMVDVRERLGIAFSTAENVCETEQNDLMSQWIFALSCAKSRMDGINVNELANCPEIFISNLSYEIRKEALEGMISNDRAAVSPIFGPEVRVQLTEKFSGCFNVEKPGYSSSHMSGAKNSDCGNAEWVVKTMTNRARAENSSKYLSMGSVALKAIEMLNRNDTRFNQASNIIRNEVKNVKYKFDDLVKILDDKSLLKVSKDVKLYDDNLTYRERFTQLLDYINENENSFDDDEQVYILALKQWIEGNGNGLSINELSNILFDTSLYLDNEEIMKPLGALDGYGSGFACIMLPLYLINHGFYTQN